MLRTSFAFLLVALAGTAANAAIGTADASAVRMLDGSPIRNSFTTRGAVGPAFTVYTGIHSPATGLVLLESTSAPTNDDLVSLGTTGEAINSYLAVAGSVQRSVTSSYQAGVTPGVDLVTITVAGRDVAGTPADLWPAGFASGGNALVNGAFGIGLNLGSLGNSPLNLAPNNALQQATLQWVTDGVLGPEINIPSAFFGPAFWNWGGILAITWGNGATGAGVQSDITLRLYIPTPATGAMLGLGGLVAFRRRRAA